MLGNATTCGTLRDAVALANASSTTATIELAAGQYELTNTAGALVISAPIKIVGQGPPATTIAQTVAGDGVIEDQTELQGGGAPSLISGVTITGGDLVAGPGTSAAGGGIDDLYGAALNLSDDVITGNQVSGGTALDGRAGNAQGGGIDDPAGGADGGTSTYDEVVVTDNTATGGSAPNDAGGTPVAGSALGGGVYAPEAVLENSTVQGNLATGGSGGGAAAGGGVDSTAVFSSTIADNSAVAGGGEGQASGGDQGAEASGGGWEAGVGLHATTTPLIDSTVFGNSVSTAVPTAPAGGGADASAGAELYGDTIVDNYADGLGGNLAVVRAGAGAELADTVLAGGQGPAGSENCFVQAGAVLADQGHNLEQDPASASQCGFSAAADVFGDPLLPASPQSAGGPTQTLAPAAGSPLLGAGGNCQSLQIALAAAGLGFADQRGEPRHTPCDIGAFEGQLPVSTTLPAVSGTPAIGQTLTCNPGAWSADGTLSYAYQWLRDGSSIAGAAAASYVLQNADADQQLVCAITATGRYGSTPALSGPVFAGELPAPALTQVAQTHSRWQEPPRRGRLVPPVGTVFTFTLNQPSRVTLSFTESIAGRLVKHRCVATSRRVERAPKCSRSVLAGSLVLAGRTGTNSLAFAGALRTGRSLPPGRYTLTIVAAHAGKTSSPVKLQFTIIA